MYVQFVYLLMRFEWDENKINIEKHGISFQEAILIFDSIILTGTDDRSDYGEIREISIGEITHGIVIVVVHTKRKDKIRIISARKASFLERMKYYAYSGETCHPIRLKVYHFI